MKCARCLTTWNPNSGIVKCPTCSPYSPSPTREQERDALVVLLRAKCTDEEWQEMGEKFPARFGYDTAPLPEYAGIKRMSREQELEQALRECANIFADIDNLPLGDSAHWYINAINRLAKRGKATSARLLGGRG